MPEFYTWVILRNNLSEKIGEKKLSVLGSRGGQISLLMHVAIYSLHYRQFLTIGQLWLIFEEEKRS